MKTIIIDVVEYNLTPKVSFHEGDWVVFNNKHQSIYQVEKIEDGYYILRHTHGGTFRVCVLHDESLRLWDIAKDAKDGDVLHTSSTASNETFIFKRLDEKTNIECFCSYDSEDKFCEGKYHFIGKPTFKTKPATKEQRDTLMKAMIDAGYTFDFEEKELMKIEQKDMHNKLTDFEYSLKHIMEEAIECGDTHNLKADADMLLRLAQNQAEWSEEDEKMIAALNEYVGHLDLIYEKITIGNDDICARDFREKVQEWLKSLKPQQKQKPWSEEDEKMFVNIKSALQNANKDYSREIGWFHLLRLQKQWRPSEKQINALSDVLSLRDIKYDVLSELLECLKKRREEQL